MTVRGSHPSRQAICCQNHEALELRAEWRLHAPHERGLHGEFSLRRRDRAVVDAQGQYGHHGRFGGRSWHASRQGMCCILWSFVAHIA